MRIKWCGFPHHFFICVLLKEISADGLCNWQKVQVLKIKLMAWYNMKVCAVYRKTSDFAHFGEVLYGYCIKDQRRT
jgi:hypothetical protein